MPEITHNIPKYIIVHHSAAITPNPQVSDINEWHKIRNFPISSLGYYVGYHYVIEKNGDLIQTRLDAEEGAHTIGQNTTSIGICLVGDFDVELPTDEQTATLGHLLLVLCDTYQLSMLRIQPHRQFANKSCYGKQLDSAWAQRVYLSALLPSLR